MHPDDAAKLVVQAFDKLPKKGKPLVRGNGELEWTVLAGVVLEHNDDGRIECVSCATGTKALPDNLLPQCNGEALHDMHAEVLALRAFNLFLLTHWSSDVYFDRHQKFRPKVHLYISEAPCGDASLTLLNDGVDYVWMDELVRVNGDKTAPVTGRDHFHQVGLVRTKPGKRTAARTFSKSCSDKLALRQVTSIVCGPVSKLIKHPIYLASLIVPESRYIESDFVRAFRQRLKADHYFEFQTTRCEFEFERRRNEDGTWNAAASPQSLIWTRGEPPEVIAHGVKMGFKTLHTVSKRRMLDKNSKRISMVARASLSAKTLALLHEHSFESYISWKYDTNRKQQKAKAYNELGQWINTSADDFSIEGQVQT